MLDVAGKVSSSPEERAERLERSSWLPPKFTRYQIKKVAAYFEIYRFKTKQHLTIEGKVAGQLGIITMGKAYVMKTTKENKLHAIAELGVNRSFGELSLIDGYPSSATVMSSDSLPFEVLVMDKKWFDAFMKEEPGLAVPVLHKIAVDMAQKLRRTTGILVDFL